MSALPPKADIRDWLRISSATVGTNGKKGTLMVLPQSTRGYLSHPKFTCHRTRFSASLRDFKTTNAENDVRCGSEGDIVAVLTNVRYTLKSSIAVRRRHVRFVPIADISHILPGPLAAAIPALALIQPHRLPGLDRALDGVSRFQVEHRLIRRGMHARPAGREEVEPSTRFVAERAPEITDRPVAGHRWLIITLL